MPRTLVPKAPKRIDRTLNPKNTWQFPEITPKTSSQQKAFKALAEEPLVALSGASGTGKTYLALWHAAKALHTGQKAKIILVRAYQPLANRSIGFMPGTLEEKLYPYYQQMLDYLEDFLGKTQVQLQLKNKGIEICSLETIRGRNWQDCTVICDESQNLYPEEVQALVTRCGEDCQMLFCGDISGFQHDTKNKQQGLEYLLEIAKKHKIKGVGAVEFTVDDILRSGVVKDWVKAFNKEQEKNAIQKR